MSVALLGQQTEGGWEQFAEGGGDDLAVGGVEDGGFGGGELEDGLAAGSAGHAGGSVEVDDGDGTDSDGWAMEGNSGGDGGLLGAGGEAVRGVFDVGAGDGLAAFKEDGGADAEVAVWGVGVTGGFGGAGVEGGDFGVGELGGHGRMRVMGEGLDGKGWMLELELSLLNVQALPALLEAGLWREQWGLMCGECW